MKPNHLIITCEHAGNQIPSAYQPLFVHATEVLNTHRGWDPGAKEIAQELATALNAPLFITEVSRLVVECNRSFGHPQLFSEFTSGLSASEKVEIVRNYYEPYREEVASSIAQKTKGGQVIHLSVHSFTPIWNGVERKTDIGLLFDEQSESEQQFCGAWQKALQEVLPSLQIDLNEPYNGADDGFTTYLRSRFKPEQYLGIEIEMNQRFYSDRGLHQIGGGLIRSLHGMGVRGEMQ